MPQTYEQYERIKAKYLDPICKQEFDLLRLSDVELRTRALELKKQVRSLLEISYDKMTDKGSDLLIESADTLLEKLPEAFALGREASRRLLGMRHYDEQIIAGAALHLGNMTELKNGEGKTIVVLLPAYLNALFTNAEYGIRASHAESFKKRGIHVMTSNNYLARRDYVWLRPVYEFLGITVGYLQEIHGTESSYSIGLMERKLMYTADVVYGSSQEFIFDYLRDNKSDAKEYQVQNGFYFAIVDEADHILLDEAQTPHLLSDESPNIPNQDVELVYLIDKMVSRFVQSPSLIELGPEESIRLSLTGHEALQSLGRRILEQSENWVHLPFMPDRAELVGLIFQLLEIIAYQKSSDIDPALLGEISRISRWSKSVNNFYTIDVNSNRVDLSQSSKAFFRERIAAILLRVSKETDPVAFLKLIIQTLQFVIAKGSGLYGELLLTLGITPHELKKLVSSKFKIQALWGILGGDKASSTLAAGWAVDILNDYLSEMVTMAFQNATQVRSFLQDVVIFSNAFLHAWNHGELPDDVYDWIGKLQAHLIGHDLSVHATNEWAPESLPRIFRAALMPVISNMLNPRVPTGRKDVITVLAVLTMRIYRDASQIPHPKTRAEREMAELNKQLGAIASNRVFEHPDQHRVSLTPWGQMLLEDYANRIWENGLWSNTPETTSSVAQDKRDLFAKMRLLAEHCLLAHLEYRRNNEYVIQPSARVEYDPFTGERISEDVVIIGELTGRMMPGRRWQQWLHSFIEAKEGLPVKRENRTAARISTQSYIQLYSKRGGMTGTAHVGHFSNRVALLRRVVDIIRSLKNRKLRSLQNPNIVTFDPIEAEFEDAYAMHVIVTPPHRELIREDRQDLVYKTTEAKLHGVVTRALELHDSNQPVLIETISVEQSQKVSALLEQCAQEEHKSISFPVLNALTHEQEAEIIGKAGLPGALTVSTQMAGRGTDIIVSDEALVLHGLSVLGVERRLSRRWDDQIQGRAGRQGEPGSSQFFVSLQDELFNYIGNQALAQRMWSEEEMALEHPWISGAILTAQIQLEHNARLRREQTARFDEILAKYRDLIYKLRQSSLEDTYPCPICGQPGRLHVTDNNSFCSTCQATSKEQGIKIKSSLPRWRAHFAKLVEASVNSCLGNDRLDQSLVAKYTSDVTSPTQWNWSGLLKELNEWLNQPTTIQILKGKIDLKNELYPEAERQQLSENIRLTLQEDGSKTLAQAAQPILNLFLKGMAGETDPRRWNLDQLVLELNSTILLNLTTAYLSEHPRFASATSPREAAAALRDIVNDSIKDKLLNYDWVYAQEPTVLRILNFFNPLLGQKNEIKRKEVLESIERRDVKKVVLDHVAVVYANLVDTYGKPQVFAYESEILRSEIDDHWREMLVESELIVEELKGWNLNELALDYGVKIADLFRKTFEDIGREVVRQVLAGRKEINDRVHSSPSNSDSSPRFMGDQDCLCGSQRAFAHCCGRILY